MAGSGRRIGVGLAVGAGLLVVLALLRSPARAPAPPAVRATPTPTPGAAAPPPTAIPPASIQGSTIASVDDKGRRQWELRAASVLVDSQAGTAALSAVVGTYFKEGRPAITFEAPRGTFFIATHVVTLSGRVRARAVSGPALEADLVRWLPRTQQLEATGAVVLHQRGMTIHADRLRADVALQRTRLEGKIRVTVDQ